MKENLLTQNYVKTLIAEDKNGKQYELNKIIVYADNGILFEERGYFDFYNYETCFNNEYIKNDIVKKIKIDFSKKENFIISEGKNCLGEIEYTLYIYYKNIDLKFVKFDCDFYLDGIFKIFEKYEIKVYLGQITIKSLELKYSINSKEFNLLSYDLFEHKDEFDKFIKKCNTTYKNYIKQKEIEKNYTEKDYKKFCTKEQVQKMENIIKCFNLEV